MQLFGTAPSGARLDEMSRERRVSDDLGYPEELKRLKLSNISVSVTCTCKIVERRPTQLHCEILSTRAAGPAWVQKHDTWGQYIAPF